MMSLADLKKLFRKYIKVVAGGPTDKTRGAGMLTVLDTLAEQLFAGMATSIAYTRDTAIADRNIGQLPPGRPTAAITGEWNGQAGRTVYLQVLEPDVFSSYGLLVNGLGQLELRKVDLDAGTATLLGPDEVDFSSVTVAWQQATSGLQGQVTKEIADRQAADATLQTQVSQNTAGISKEVTDRQAADVALAAALRDGVPAGADTLQKLYNQLQLRATQYNVATLAARNALSVKVGDWVNVDDDGDGRWAIYRATSAGPNASYNKVSDPDLLNAAMTAPQIKAAYESNSNTNAFTNALLAKLTGIATGATANSTDAQLRDRSTHTGTQAIGTVAGLADALASKLDVSNAWPDLSSETQILTAYPTNKILAGYASVFDGDVSRELPSSIDPYTGVAGLMYWRATSATTITFPKGKVDGATTLTLAAGEWLLLLGQGGRSSADAIWYIRMRGSVKPPASATGSTGIDYANPVTLSAATTLQINKAHYVSGSGYALALPDPATTPIGASLFVEIDPAATGFFAIGQLSIKRNGEGTTLRNTTAGWRELGPLVRGVRAELRTTPSQQDALNGSGQIPLSLVGQDTFTMADAPNARLVIPRTSRYLVAGGGIVRGPVDQTQVYVAFIRVHNPDGSEKDYAVSGIATGAIQTSATLDLLAGTTLTLRYYFSTQLNMFGQADGNCFFLSATEI